MRRVLLPTALLVAIMTIATSTFGMRGGAAPESHSNCDRASTATAQTVVDAIAEGGKPDPAVLDAPLCSGGPSTADLLAARAALECAPPVVNWRIDWERAVVVVTLTAGYVPDWPDFAVDRGIDPELLSITPPNGFRKLAGCLPE